MKLCTWFLLFRIFAYTNSFNTTQEDNKTAKLALEVVLQLQVNKNLNNIFVRTNNTVIDDTRIPRPVFKEPRVETFTEFVQRVANLINNYDDNSFKDFFDVLDEEIRKYHYRGCKFYELTDNNEFRSLMAEKLDLMKRKPTAVLKGDINEVVNVLGNVKDKHIKEMLDYINSLYGEDDREKFNKVISDLNDYGKSRSKRPNKYLVKVIRNGVRTIVFDHYTDLNVNVRREFKKELGTFLKKIKEFPSSTPTTILFPYKPALREPENIDKISGYNIVIEDKNIAHHSKRDPITTAIGKNILTMKANDVKQGKNATNLNTSKKDIHSQQMKLTRNKENTSTDETIERNSIESLQEPLSMKDYGENIYKSELKSKLVQKMLDEESTGKLPTVRATTTPRLRQVTLLNEDTEVESVKLRKAITLRAVSDEDLRRSRPAPMPGENLSIDVFDREERRRQKSLAKEHSITTVQIGIKDYIIKIKNLQNELNQLKKIDEYNRKTRMNVTSAVGKVRKRQKPKLRNSKVKKTKDMKHRERNKRKKNKKIKTTINNYERQIDEYEARTQTELSKDRKTKREAGTSNPVNKDIQDLESNTEKVKTHNKHTHKLKKQKKDIRNESTKAKNIHPTHKGITSTKEVGNVSLSVTGEAKQKSFINTTKDDYIKDNPTRRYRRVIEFTSPPLYDQPFFEDYTFQKIL